MTEAAIADPEWPSGGRRAWGPIWNLLRTAARENGWSADRQAFVQQRGSGVLDSSLLLMSSVGFVSPYV
jgi:GH15 family glucan-1,4-alpha-glucosidase